MNYNYRAQNNPLPQQQARIRSQSPGLAQRVEREEKSIANSLWKAIRPQSMRDTTSSQQPTPLYESAQPLVQKKTSNSTQNSDQFFNERYNEWLKNGRFPDTAAKISYEPIQRPPAMMKKIIVQEKIAEDDLVPPEIRKEIAKEIIQEESGRYVSGVHRYMPYMINGRHVATSNKYAIYGEVYANRYSDFEIVKEKSYGAQTEFPGLGGQLDQVFRDQFLDFSNKGASKNGSPFFQSLRFMLFWGCLLYGFFGHFKFPTPSHLLNLYATLVTLPFIILVDTYRKLNAKHKFDPERNVDTANECYDPEGTIFSNKVNKKYSMEAGSVSMYIARTPVFAWNLLFMCIGGLVADWIRADYYPHGIDDEWVNHFGFLPNIQNEKKWMLFAIMKCVGLAWVVITTRWFGALHNFFIVVALVGSIGQTTYLGKLLESQFWTYYYQITWGVAAIFLTNCIMASALINTTQESFFLKRALFRVACFIRWPFEWTTVSIVYLLCYCEVATHWAYIFGLFIWPSVSLVLNFIKAFVISPEMRLDIKTYVDKYLAIAAEQAKIAAAAAAEKARIAAENAAQQAAAQAAAAAEAAAAQAAAIAAAQAAAQQVPAPMPTPAQ